jgi:hypothetical protein
MSLKHELDKEILITERHLCGRKGIIITLIDEIDGMMLRQTLNQN